MKNLICVALLAGCASPLFGMQGLSPAQQARQKLHEKYRSMGIPMEITAVETSLPMEIEKTAPQVKIESERLLSYLANPAQLHKQLQAQTNETQLLENAYSANPTPENESKAALAKVKLQTLQSLFHYAVAAQRGMALHQAS